MAMWRRNAWLEEARLRERANSCVEFRSGRSTEADISKSDGQWKSSKDRSPAANVGNAQVNTLVMSLPDVPPGPSLTKLVISVLIERSSASNPIATSHLSLVDNKSKEERLNLQTFLENTPWEICVCCVILDSSYRKEVTFLPASRATLCNEPALRVFINNVLQRRYNFTLPYLDSRSEKYYSTNR
jgi:hypothetical protein